MKLEKPMSTIESKAIEWLVDYDLQRKPSGVQDCRIKNNKAWLSGFPYLWTQFPERAYVFATIGDANTFIRKFATISGSRMHVIEQTPRAPINKPQDFAASCGCVVRFDNDGLIRLQQCSLHANAGEMLKACKGLLKYARAISCRGDNVEKRAARLAIKKSEGRV